MIVYKISNTKNDKVYIGVTRRTDETARVREHMNSAFTIEKDGKLYNAMRDLGREDENGEIWKFEILHKNVANDETLSRLEKNLILFYKSFINGYNSNSGGLGTSITVKRGKKPSKVRIKVSPIKVKWCSYTIEGIHTGKCYNNLIEAGKDVGLSDTGSGHISHAAKWQEGNPTQGNGTTGRGQKRLMWLKVDVDKEPPKSIDSYVELHREIRKLEPNRNSREYHECGKNNDDCVIVQYDLDGNFVKEWENNISKINDAGYKGNISDVLNGKAIHANHNIWRWYKRGEEIKNKIDSPYSKINYIDTSLFYSEPVLKVNPVNNEIIDRFESISKIPRINNDKKYDIYDKVTLNNKEVENGSFWVFEKDFNNNTNNDTNDTNDLNECIRRIKDLISKI